MKESARVIRRVDPLTVEVEIKQISDCAKCGMCHFDNSGVLMLQAVDEIGVKEGDMVEINIPEGKVLLSGFLLFLFPLIAFFAGFMIRGIFLGTILLAAYLVFLYVYDRRAKTIPFVTRILSNR